MVHLYRGPANRNCDRFVVKRQNLHLRNPGTIVRSTAVIFCNKDRGSGTARRGFRRYQERLGPNYATSASVVPKKRSVSLNSILG
jgi:hypothetical protein